MATRFRRRLRTAADQGARLFGLLDRQERACASGLTVLTYHRVLSDARSAAYPFASLAMPLDAFRAQVRWLAAHHEVLPLAAALERHRNASRPARPLVAITFDDGYSDAAETVAPVLEDCGLRGTFFVTTGFIESRGLLWFDRAALLFAQVPEPVRREIVLDIAGSLDAECRPHEGAGPGAWTALLKTVSLAQREEVLLALERAAGGPPSAEGFQAVSVAELVGMHRHGHEIGSHTVTHALLPELHEPGLGREIDGARAALAAWLGSDVPGFCYPNGDFDERVVAAVQRAGHRHACTTHAGIHRSGDDPFTIRRVDVVPERTLDGARRFAATAFRRELCGLYRRPAREPVGS